MGRHAGEIRFRDLDEISEDGIEAHLERFDPGAGDFSFLQLGDPALASAGSLAQFVELFIVAIAKNTAFLQGEGRIIEQRAA